ncbi:hypothetical protein DFJ74DRAFT_755342 [Hyaloraphidium curvatum]|nr:hypothetical protein DFJ74DRAFT_755342 [Hyaloraphidium curvatum]
MSSLAEVACEPAEPAPKVPEPGLQPAGAGVRLRNSRLLADELARLEAERLGKRMGGSEGSLLEIGTGNVSELSKSAGGDADVPARTPSAERRRCGMRGTTFDAAYLGLCFACLFTAWSVTQNFLTTLFPGYGFLSLALIFASFGISSLLAPTLGRLPPISGDPRLAILFGGSLYCNAMLAVASGSVAYLLASSALAGLGAAMVWIHQGVYIEAVARKRAAADAAAVGEDGPEGAEARLRKSVGEAAGTFWPLVALAGLLGNSVGLIVLSSGANSSTMIWTFFGIGLGALVLMFFANSEYREHRRILAPQATEKQFYGQKQLPEKQLSEKQLGVAVPPPTRRTGDFADLFAFLRSKLALLTMPMFIMQGCTAAFNGGVMSSMVGLDGGGPKTLTTYYLIHAVCGTIAAPTTSRIFQIRGGWTWCTLLCAVALAAELSLSMLIVAGRFGLPGDSTRHSVLLTTAVAAGTFDASFNALISCTIMKLSRDGPRPLVVFSAYRAASCLLGFVPVSVAATLTRPHGDGLPGWWAVLEACIGGWFVLFAATYSVLNLRGRGRVAPGPRSA